MSESELIKEREFYKGKGKTMRRRNEKLKKEKDETGNIGIKREIEERK